MVYPINYYPISFLPITPLNEPITFNPEYIQNLQALGVFDYFLPSQFVTNPLFAQVSDFNQTIGILQTATNSLEKILTLVGDIKNTNPPEDVIKTLQDEINSIINNTTFNDKNVFASTLNIDGKTINLSVPTFNPDNMTLDEYYDLINSKYTDLLNTYKNLSLNLPEFNPNEFNLTNYNLYNAYNFQNLSPDILQILLEG